MDCTDIITLIKEFERKDKQSGGQYTEYSKPQRFISYLKKQQRVFDELLLILERLNVEAIDNESATIDAQDAQRLNMVVRYYFRFERRTAAANA